MLTRILSPPTLPLFLCYLKARRPQRNLAIKGIWVSISVRWELSSHLSQRQFNLTGTQLTRAKPRTGFENKLSCVCLRVADRGIKETGALTPHCSKFLNRSPTEPEPDRQMVITVIPTTDPWTKRVVCITDILRWSLPCRFHWIRLATFFAPRMLESK